MNWYYEQDGVSMGPVSDSTLPELVNNGSITGDSLVWHPGLDDWATALLMKPTLFAPKAAAPEPSPPLPAEPAEEVQEQEIKVKPVRGGAPSPSRLKRQAPSEDALPPALPEKKVATKDSGKKKPGLLKRLFGGGE